jgi:threonine efflux protein
LLSTLFTIALLHWVVLITPGVNLLLISQLAANGHRRAAVFAALGVTSVALTWSVLAILGVSAIFSAHPYLRLALQFAGGAYLIYIAIRLWQAGTNLNATGAKYLSPFAAFRMGFLTNIMNPKSALFFGSVFATTIPVEPTAAMMVAAVCLSTANTLCWHMFLALAFSHHKVQATYARQSRTLNRVAGIFVGAFGLRLLVATVEEIRAK